MEQLDEIVKEFLVESYENLDQLDSDLLALEEVPDDLDRLASIFRTIHSIKGTSGFLAFPNLEKVTHVGENLLVPLRDGELRLTNEIADGLLAMVDAVRDILRQIESTGVEGEGEYADLLSRLEQLKDPGAAAPPITTDESSDFSDNPGDNDNAGGSEATIAPAATTEDTIAVAEHSSETAADFTALEATASLDGQSPSSNTADSSSEVAASESASPAPTPPQKPAPETQPTPVAKAVEPKRGSDEPDRSSHNLADSTVRLDVKLLDRLMNLVGELVLSRNQIIQFSRRIEDASMTAACQRLNLITTELQEGVMKTRMQPIRNAWSKLPRVVRDLASSCGKQVEVVMEGAETELDKTILEAIKDPLTHIVRNSVDHGIESPDVRESNGKPKEGTLWLRAFHEGGQVNIEIVDDGGGINIARVKEKAISRGLVSEEQVEQMTERELTNLVLLPGFSTAAKVTNVSGRGVGMDVVKTNVEKIGGTLDIHSVPGKGTTLRIKIPLTLAIVPALIITSDGDRYAIPQVSLLELVRLEGDRAKREIETIHSVPVYRLRGNLLPLLYLNQELRTATFSPETKTSETVNIVVLQAEDRQFGLVVDEINDTQEIVVKPLCDQLQSISAYAGATIMGDGTVALILDVLGLARQGNVVTENHEKAISNAGFRSNDQGTRGHSVLIVDPGDGGRVAIPLSSVARLEEFDASRIEQVNHRPVVQYRGQIMPLVGVDGAPTYASGSSDLIHVVVHSRNGRDIGVLVGSILDIVTESNIDLASEERIIDGRVTQVVDLSRTLAHLALPDEFSAA